MCNIQFKIRLYTSEIRSVAYSEVFRKFNYLYKLLHKNAILWQILFIRILTGVSTFDDEIHGLGPVLTARDLQIPVICIDYADEASFSLDFMFSLLL